MSANQDTDQPQQCKLFEPAAEDARVTVSFEDESRFTLEIPTEIPKSTLRLIPAVKPSSEMVVLSTHSQNAGLFKLTMNGNDHQHYAEFFRGLVRLTDPVIDASVDLMDESVLWLHKKKDSSRYITDWKRGNGSLAGISNHDSSQTNIKLMLNDIVLRCDEAGKLEIRDRKGELRKNDSLRHFSCKTGMIGEKNGECFGLVKKEDGDQARLHLIQKSDLTEYRQSIPIDNAFKPGVLSEDCTMHAQKIEDGIRVTDIMKGGITKEIHLDGMEPGQVLFFDDASKVIVGALGNACQFQVIDLHSGVKLDTAGIPSFEGCSNLVKSNDGALMFLSQNQGSNGAMLMNVIQCNVVCRLVNSHEIRMPNPVHHFSLPSPNQNQIAFMQRSNENLSPSDSIAIIDTQQQRVVHHRAMFSFPSKGVQWQSNRKLIARYFHDSYLRIDSFSIIDQKLIRDSKKRHSDIAVMFGQCTNIIQFPYDRRVLCTGEATFTVAVSNADWKQDRVEQKSMILPDPSVKFNHHFSIDGEWMIIHEEHHSDDEKGLIKWFHSDSLDLDRSCEYSKSEIQGLEKIQSCWMDSETNVYSDGSEIKVQRIGVGILGSMDIGYEPTALQCANGFVITSSDKGMIDAWNMEFTFKVSPRILSPNWPNQTESVLIYPERVRTLKILAERGNVSATTEGYRSKPPVMTRPWMIAGIVAAVLLVSVLIALLIWIRAKRVKSKSQKREERGETVVTVLHPMPEPGSENSWTDQREGVTPVTQPA